MSDPDEQTDAKQVRTPRRLVYLASIGLTFLVFYVHGGWPAPEVNEGHYLAKAKHYWNPQWCQGDFFLESADAHLVFYWTIGWMTIWLPLPVVAWTGRCVGWWMLSWSWCRLSRALDPQPLWGPLSAALFVTLLDRFDLAGEWVVGGVEAKVFAYSLVFFALEAAVRERWNRAWLLIGAASAFHVLVGGWSAVAIGASWAFDRNRPDLAKMLPGLAGGAVIAMLGLVPAWQLTAGNSPEVIDQANQIYVFERLSHHLAIHRTHDMTPRLLRHSLLIGLFTLACVWYRVATASGARRRAMRKIVSFATTAVVVAACGLLLGWATERHPALAARLLRYYWFRLTDVALPMATSLLVVGCVSAMIARRARLAALALFLVILVSTYHIGMLMADRRAIPIPRGDRTLAKNKLANHADWLDACQWIASNTAEDSTFIVPRMAQSFHWYTGRREVVTNKNIPQNATAIVEWHDRINSIHRWPGSDRRKYYPNLSLRTADDLRALGDRFGADYLLTEDEHRLALPPAYRNRTYVVYELFGVPVHESVPP